MLGLRRRRLWLKSHPGSMPHCHCVSIGRAQASLAVFESLVVLVAGNALDGSQGASATGVASFHCVCVYK